jgi:eukaryotic-like serine/threonine-protein kinase
MKYGCSHPSPAGLRLTDLRAQLQEGLGDSYALERELGRGGMATVFLAHDHKHDRPVALKVLHRELAASLGHERFQREIRLAARLQHPHILTVLDSGEVAVTGAPSLLWFTMPFVRGESLRDRLKRETQLPVEDALRITREAADALQYAHGEGVIHRDIKPENILLAGTHALVADFGIARAVGAAGDQLTGTGLALGTPAYMSPEQAAGQREIDGRTDVYSLGLTLYEMLAGQTPFAAPSAQATITRRLMETAAPVRQLREAVPEHVEQALQRALARTPADRFGSAAEFAAALAPPTVMATRPPSRSPSGTETAAQAAPGRNGTRRRIPVAAGSLVLGLLIGLGVLFGWLRRHGADDAGTAGAKRLAVLPFDNLGGSDDEYFADGVTDEVRGKLTSLPGLLVTARSSSNQYRRTAKRPQEIGRELGVDYLLTGTVRWEKGGSASHVRVSPELIQVATGATRWQQPFDAALTDVFQVQADVAGQVAQALDVALGTSQRQELAERPTANAAAYDAYLKGEAVSQNMGVIDPLRLRNAITLYEQAVALDSGFARAWAQLSRAHSLLYVNGTPSQESARRGLDAAERAKWLAPGHDWGLLALGDHYNYVQREYPRALEAYEAALRIAPNDAELLASASAAEISSGRWEDALRHLTRAQTLDPRSALVSRRLVYTNLRMRRYPEAMAAVDRALALDSTSVALLQNKAMTLLAQGKLDRARELTRTAPAAVDRTALVASFGNYYDLYWALPSDLQELLLRLTPSAFDDRAIWASVQAQLHAFRHEPALARAYADSALTGIDERLRAAPEDAQIHVFRGLALAYLGRKAEAIREGEKAVALQPIAKDAFTGPYLQHQLVRIYILTGEPERALDRLEPLLRVPYYLSPGWLRIDPNFDPLRSNPRFQRLLQGTT